jgi:hypothetical protein
MFRTRAELLSRGVDEVKQCLEGATFCVSFWLGLRRSGGRLNRLAGRLLSALDTAPVKTASMKIAQSPPLTKPPRKPASPKPASPKVDVDLAQALPSEQRVPAQASFSETSLLAVSSPKNSDQLLVQRPLTISDMKDYVKRTYPASRTAGLTD